MSSSQATGDGRRSEEGRAVNVGRTATRTRMEPDGPGPTLPASEDGHGRPRTGPSPGAAVSSSPSATSANRRRPASVSHAATRGSRHSGDRQARKQGPAISPTSRGAERPPGAPSRPTRKTAANAGLGGPLLVQPRQARGREQRRRERATSRCRGWTRRLGRGTARSIVDNDASSDPSTGSRTARTAQGSGVDRRGIRDPSAPGGAFWHHPRC